MSLFLLSVISSVCMLAADLSHSDASFLKDAAEGGLDEVRLGELATQNATSQEVKDFARRMMDDHSRMNNDLRVLATQKNVSMPDDIGLKDKASLKLLSAKHGVDFDKAYISQMVKDHRADMEAFSKEMNTAADGDVKALAAKALPVIREHLEMAQKIASSIGAQ